MLLAIAVVTGLAALFTFRSDSSVFPDSRLNTFLLTAFGDFVPDYVHIYLLPDPNVRGMAVHFYVVSVTDPTTRMVLSTDVSGVDYVLSPWVHYQSGYEKYVRFILPGVGDNESENSEFVTALLPKLEFINYASITNPGPENVQTVISVAIPDASKYNWTSGSPPAFGGILASWNFLTSPSTTTTETGVSLSVQDRNTKLVFISGALLGVAGGALVGAIQEVMDERTKEA
jgi:hypothetical protein